MFNNLFDHFQLYCIFGTFYFVAFTATRYREVICICTICMYNVHIQKNTSYEPNLLKWWSGTRNFCHFIDIDIVCIAFSWALNEKNKRPATITIYKFIYHPGKKIQKRCQPEFRIRFLCRYLRTATSCKDADLFLVWCYICTYILFPRNSPMTLPLSEASLTCTWAGWIFFEAMGQLPF